jgi:hypothetical protein
MRGTWGKIQELIGWVRINGGTIKPSENYSDARWRAIVKHINREYLYRGR